MPDWIQALLTLVVGPSVLALIAWLTGRRSAKAQERTSDRSSDHKQIELLQKDVDGLRRSLDASHRRERIRDDYIAQLRQRIPDPPPWPEGLTAGDTT